MQFPPWANGPKLSKKQRASLRLRYIISKISLQISGRQSHRALAEHVGLNHSTISLYVSRGAFSEKAAKTIEERVGRTICRAEWLTDPLNIETT